MSRRYTQRGTALLLVLALLVSMPSMKMYRNLHKNNRIFT